MDKPTVSIVNWNVEWRLPASHAASVLRSRIAEHDPDIVCLTEAYSGMLPDGFTIEADPDYGYPIREGRRKVLLWSKEPWSGVDIVGDPCLPSGRFLRGRTSSPVGQIDVIGVCVPWSAAHATTGRRDRRPWEDHLEYLAGLQRVLSGASSRLLVIGDYNQKVPRSTAPLRAYGALEEAVLKRLLVATSGRVAPIEVPLIDHVAHSPDLRAIAVTSLSNLQEGGPRLTDHVGVAVQLCATEDW